MKRSDVVGDNSGFKFLSRDQPPKVSKPKNLFSKKSSKGLSTIVATLIIILLVLVATGIIWVVVRNVIQEGSEQVSLGKFTLDLELKNVQRIGETNSMSVQVKRNAGAGEFVALNFIFDDGDNAVIVKQNVSLKELEQKTYTMEVLGINLSNLRKVSIAPVFRLESGKEVVGDVKDFVEFGSGGSSIQTCSQTCESLSYQCGSVCGQTCGDFDGGCDEGLVCSVGSCVDSGSCTDDCSTTLLECGSPLVCGDSCSLGSCSGNENICNGAYSCESCSSGYADCNGDDVSCETNLNNDVNNCGSCGNVCGSEQSCVSGDCVDNVVEQGIELDFDSAVKVGDFNEVDGFACGGDYYSLSSGTNYVWDNDLPTDRLEIPVNLDGGDYKACVRIAASSGTQDAFYFGFSSSDMRRAYPGTFYGFDGSWIWVDSVPDDSERLTFTNLPSGSQTAYLGAGEVGAKIDKVVLTNDLDFDCGTLTCDESGQVCETMGEVCLGECGTQSSNCGEDFYCGSCGGGSEELLAFPGAEGFGRYTRGAYGNPSVEPKILIVDDLDCHNVGDEASGRGTLTWALKRNYPRVILFEVSGNVDYYPCGESNFRTYITNPYLTVAGESAPSPGITVKRGQMIVQASNVIIRHMRFRVGNELGMIPNQEPDGFSIAAREGYDVRNVTLDHISISWGVDENFGISETSPGVVRDITLSNSILHQAIYNGGHVDSGPPTYNPHSMGILANGGDNYAFIKNVLSNHYDRGPMLGSKRLFMLNNLIYNMEVHRIYLRGTSKVYDAALIGNVHGVGPDTAKGSTGKYTLVRLQGPQNPDTRIYFEDNFAPDMTSDIWSIIDPYEERDQIPDSIFATSNPLNDIGNFEQIPHSQVLSYLTSNAGARPADRDSVDEEAISNINSGGSGGHMVSCVRPEICSNDAGGWPDLAENTRALASVPGYPSSNPNGDDDGDGYSNLEEWLHQQSCDLGVPSDC